MACATSPPKEDCTSADQTFIIGSLSKSFTAVCVMQLVEQGAIDLDAPAALYAPGYGVPSVVTVRDLLNQTSGFGYFQPLADATVGETLGSFSYSNANYDLLGRIVENVSGETYATICAQTSSTRWGWRTRPSMGWRRDAHQRPWATATGLVSAWRMGSYTSLAMMRGGGPSSGVCARKHLGHGNIPGDVPQQR